MRRGQADGSGRYYTVSPQGIGHSNRREPCGGVPSDTVNLSNSDNQGSMYLLFRSMQHCRYLDGELLCAVSHNLDRKGIAIVECCLEYDRAEGRKPSLTR